jgi:hypothetical protein
MFCLKSQVPEGAARRERYSTRAPTVRTLIPTFEAEPRLEENSGGRNFNFAAKYPAISSPFMQKNQRTRNGTDRAQPFMTGSA